MTREVKVVPHNPAWKTEFQVEAKRINNALVGRVEALHHIGSTVIPNITAKPIIDILLEVETITDLDEQASAMEQLGYEAMGEFGIPGRRFFLKDDTAGLRTHHVHAFQVGHAGVTRHLAFRDYMIAHPQEAQRYSALKQSLAQAHPHDIEAYMAGKGPYIKEQEAQALVWNQKHFLTGLTGLQVKKSC
ncbi:GrpB family protein [Anaerolineales bacterium HSG25]|nr:GrpB family protein [Anaerolineales bacterium HSG25]